MRERPAVKKGADVPEPNRITELLKDPKKVEEQVAEARKWILQK